MITIHGTLDDLNEIMGNLGEITPQMFATMQDMPITTYEDCYIGHITNINIYRSEWTGVIDLEACDIRTVLQADGSVQLNAITVG